MKRQDIYRPEGRGRGYEKGRSEGTFSKDAYRPGTKNKIMER